MKRTIISIFIYRFTPCLLLANILLGSCKKADQAYDRLQQIPELELTTDFAYRSYYVVGDTLVMYGRLHPEKSDFRVRIGDSIAPVIAWEHISAGLNTILYPQGLDRVQLKITAGMGVGRNRPVRVTSGGYQIEGPGIEISMQASGGGYLTDSLELVSYYRSPDPDRKILHCVNGKGSIYLYENGAFKLLKNGVTTPLLADFTDQHGAFGIQLMLGGGVDPQEHYLYFSVVCTETGADAANNHIFRLCRYDLQSGELTSLNRTLFPKKWSNTSLANWQPFEGAIGQVKFFAAKGIYPDSKGNVILDLFQPFAGPWFGDDVLVGTGPGGLVLQAMLRPGGTLKYQYRATDGLPYRLYYWDPATSSVTSATALPGTALNGVLRARYSPEDQLMYTFYAVGFQAVGYRVYDLAAGTQLYNFVPKADFGSYVVTGPFSALNFRADPYSPSNTGQFDYFPLPGERLMTLFFTRGYPELDGKATVFDFANNTATLYAPHIESGSFSNKLEFVSPEQVLNYDEEGNLYLLTYHIDWIEGAEYRDIVKTRKRH